MDLRGLPFSLMETAHEVHQKRLLPNTHPCENKRNWFFSGKLWCLSGVRDLLDYVGAPMCPRLRWVFSVLVLGLNTGLAQVPGKQESHSNDMEVRFADSSSVRMVLVQDTIEVMTKYGRLTVPTNDLRRIEFGVHPSPEISEKIQEATKRLASPKHPEREAASKELVVLGHQAYPALHAAAKTSDPEVGRRAEDALKQIRARVPSRLLRLRVSDRIETTEFTIVGRVTSESLKAKSAYFGERSININDVISIRALASGANVEVSIDAAKYGSAHDQWLNTDIDVNAETDVLITATGKVDLWVDGTGQYVTGPNGYSGAVAGPRWNGAVGAQRGGALLGRIGDDGEVFVIGERYKGTASHEGKLHLHIVPSPWGNPSVGNYNVQFITGSAP
jgi:hypothetical protein